MTAAYYFRDEIEKAIGVDVVDVAKRAANFVIGSFRAAYRDVEFIWSNFGDMMGAAVIGGLNAAGRGISAVIETIAESIDKLIDKLNEIPGVNLPKIGTLSPVGELPIRIVIACRGLSISAMPTSKAT